MHTSHILQTKNTHIIRAIWPCYGEVETKKDVKWLHKIK